MGTVYRKKPDRSQQSDNNRVLQSVTASLRDIPMRNEPLLTRDELAFLQQLLDEPSPSATDVSRLVVDSSPAIRALVASLGEGAQFTVEAQVDGQRLSFPLRLVRDDVQTVQIQLDVPQIYENGVVERPWRASLPAPLALVDRTGRATGLSVVQLSLNGALVVSENEQPLPENFTYWLELPDNSTLSLRGKRVRMVDEQTAAYRITPLKAQGLTRLQELLVQLRIEQQDH